MKFEAKNPPRTYKCGINNQIQISDCGNIKLDSDEQVTFVTASGKEYDLAAKSWGFYATPSINSRLTNQGFKTALVKNSQSRHYVMLVEKDKVNLFEEYLAEEKIELLEWLDEKK